MFTYFVTVCEYLDSKFSVLLASAIPDVQLLIIFSVDECVYFVKYFVFANFRLGARCDLLFYEL